MNIFTDFWYRISDRTLCLTRDDLYNEILESMDAERATIARLVKEGGGGRRVFTAMRRAEDRAETLRELAVMMASDKVSDDEALERWADVTGRRHPIRIV